MWEWDKIRKLQMCSGLGICSFPGFQEHLEEEQGEVQVQLYKKREVEDGSKKMPEKMYEKVLKLVLYTQELVSKLKCRIQEKETLE